MVIDTGTDDTIVPKRVFSMILEAIEAEVGRGRVANSPEAAQAAKLKRLDAFVSSAGWIKVRKKVLGKLPVLVIQGESGSAFEMHLTHHVHSCEGEWCRLLVTSRLRADDSFDNFILGAPFFAEHDVYIDLYRGLVGLSTPREAVVKEIPSHDEFVIRRVTLKLSKGEIRNLQVGLMIGSSRIEDGQQPFATLGLSIPSSKPITEAAIPPLLSQLVSAGAISETAFSVRVSEFGVGITGQLILGESAAKRQDTKFFPLSNVSWSAALFAIPASGVRVQSAAHGGHVRELSMKRDSLPVAIDTGCDVTTIPKGAFSMIWATIASTFGHEHVASRPPTVQPSSFDHLYARIDPKGWIWLRRTMTEYLPRVIVQGAAGSTFEVDLRYHSNLCVKEWCRLLISAGGSPDAFILGGPFLAQHDVYVNLDRKEVGISTPDRPVVKQLASHESWDQMRAPPCGRRVQRCSAGAARRCIKRPVRK
ncbi:hypothetical protein FOZ62_003886 [Perkinsus olseni]|uniref:Peptidase A1 domain-containing protein n=1 Tax=Perkinsus olseni TaxID=32597 RepID=A0A7J6RQ45_PEROL|nr:hypothetical protein FOZ62_003886 [Perkinsus olseni]